MGGEIPLLNQTPQISTSRAILPSTLMVFDVENFRQIFAAVPLLGSRILRTASERMAGVATRLTQDQKLAALGKFSAGLAHELNNPASAARRSSQTLYELLPQLQAKTMGLCALGLDNPHLYELLTWEHDVSRSAVDLLPLPPLERSDREDEIGDWLDEMGVEEGYDRASVFVSSGLAVDDLKALVQRFPQEASVGILEWTHSALYASSLLCEIDDSATRISELVKAVKEYTYMDQDKMQEVDIHKSLENTLKVLGHKVKNVQVEREYDPDLPKIWGNGGEINQVWTNLIDNAVDAVKDNPDGLIRLVTRCETDFAMIEIADNGTGIPKDMQANIFEPFFTTKGVGQGTGLGLDIVYRIIQQHKGTIEVQSQPGHTRFIVRLPVRKSNGNGHVESD
jgi:signal transduction histidine kinase